MISNLKTKLEAAVFAAFISVLLSLGFSPEGQTAPSSSVSSAKSPCALSENATNALQLCSKIMPTWIEGLEKRVNEQVIHLYQGKSIDPTDTGEGCSTADSSVGKCSGADYAFVKPVCCLTPNSFNQQKGEITENHLTEPCGERIHVSVGRGGSPVRYDARGLKGTRELAYYGGAFVQATACYLEQVKKEVQSAHALLTLSSSCQAIADDLSRLLRDYTLIAARLNDQLLGSVKSQADMLEISRCYEKNTAQNKDIWSCYKQWDDARKSVSKNFADVGPLRQSVTHLSASRAAMESMFNQLLICETFARSSKDFLSTFGDVETFTENVKKTVGKKCGSECKATCTKKCRKKCKMKLNPRSCAKSCAGSCGTSCGNSCYEREIRSFIETQQKRWPNSGSCGGTL